MEMSWFHPPSLLSFPALVIDPTPTPILHLHKSPIFVIWLGKEWAASLANDRTLWGSWDFVFSLSQVP